MDFVVLIGRILFAYLFLSSGVNHFLQRNNMAGYAGAKGVPMPMASTLASGALQILGGLSVLLGIWADLGSLLIAVFIIPTAVLMHAFWKETDAQAKMMAMIQFNKDLALGGAALALMGLFSIAGDDLGLTLTGPLFR
jgi:uncharacterized membrane protein YphA (DoxX/SURF4 family)